MSREITINVEPIRKMAEAILRTSRTIREMNDTLRRFGSRVRVRPLPPLRPKPYRRGLTKSQKRSRR